MRNKNIEAWISDSKGKKLIEYNTTLELGVCTCYIASEVGHEFQFHWKDERPNRAGISIDCYVDGQNVDRYMQDASDDAQGYCEGFILSATSFKPFKFAKPKLSDSTDATLLADDPSLKELASLRIKCYRSERVGERFKQEPKLLDKISNRILDEKSKKAGALAAVSTLGEEQQSHMELSYSDVRYIDPADGTPFCEFVYHYMPKEMLEARDIIPISRQKRDVASKSKKPKARPSIAELDELALLRAENKRLKKQVKREHSHSGITISLLDEDADVKPSCNTAFKTARDSQGRTVIELDSDSD